MLCSRILFQYFQTDKARIKVVLGDFNNSGFLSIKIIVIITVYKVAEIFFNYRRSFINIKSLYFLMIKIYPCRMSPQISTSDTKSVITYTESNDSSVFCNRQILKANIRNISVVSIFNFSLNQSCVKVSFNYIDRHYRSVFGIVINRIIDSIVNIHIYNRSSFVDSECLTLNTFIYIT